MGLKTKFQKAKEASDRKIYDAYHELINAGAMKTAAENQVMKTFKIFSRATVWQTCQRVERRINEQSSKQSV